jgi:hypothetical protein
MGVERTSLGGAAMSANDPKQTWHHCWNSLEPKVLKGDFESPCVKKYTNPLALLFSSKV